MESTTNRRKQYTIQGSSFTSLYLFCSMNNLSVRVVVKLYSYLRDIHYWHACLLVSLINRTANCNDSVYIGRRWWF